MLERLRKFPKVLGALVVKGSGMIGDFCYGPLVYPMEIPTVSEELYTRTREALTKEGYSFVVAIEPVSIGQLVVDKKVSLHVAYDGNLLKTMRSIAPPQMEVAINPKNLRIINSNFKSTDTQIRMIREEEAALKGKLSEEVRDLIGMRMQGASVLAQLDDKYQKETGEVIFTDWFGRTDDQMIPGNVIDVGRGDPTSELIFLDSRRDRGCDGGRGAKIFAFPMVVLPRKLVA